MKKLFLIIFLSLLTNQAFADTNKYNIFCSDFNGYQIEWEERRSTMINGIRSKSQFYANFSVDEKREIYNGKISYQDQTGYTYEIKDMSIGRYTIKDNFEYFSFFVGGKHPLTQQHTSDIVSIKINKKYGTVYYIEAYIDTITKKSSDKFLIGKCEMK